MKDPIDIKIPENVILENGSMFVRLKTLEELDEFWQKNKDRFSFAAYGIYDPEGALFLDEYEWVFGPNKISVVETVTRWKEVGIGVVFKEEYGGWWSLKNLPYGIESYEWMADGYPEENDPKTDVGVVESLYKEATFDYTYDCDSHIFITKEDIDGYIMKNFIDKDMCGDYYGAENEA